MLQLPEAGPQLTGITYSVTDSRKQLVCHDLPARMEHRQNRREVSPRFPSLRGPQFMEAYQPSACHSDGQPHFYPGTTVKITAARSTTASAALGRPPSASPERNPSKESLREPEKESHRRETVTRRHERRGESTRHRTPPPRGRRTSTPVRPSEERDRASSRRDRNDPSR